MKHGDIITLKVGATYYNGKSVPSWVFKSTLYYRGTNENGIIFSTQKTGSITGVVRPEMVNEFNGNNALTILNKCLEDIENLQSFKELSELL